MSLNYPRLKRIVVSSDHEVKIPEQLLARIEEYNQRDYQAMARGKEERTKWLLAKSKGKEKSPS